MNQSEIANSFKAELAARYDLLELLSSNLRLQSKVDNTTIFSTGFVPVNPRGQFAGVSRSVGVNVTVIFDDKDPVKVSGQLAYQFQLHSGGTNGARQSFFLVVDRVLGGEETEYKGFVNSDLFLQQYNNFS